MGKLTEAQAAAIERYHQRTYKAVTIKLRLEDDADILADMERAKQEGLTLRQWLRDLYEGR